MKKNYSAVFLFILSSGFLINTISCTKTNTVTKTITDTVTVIQKDTIVQKDTLLTASILTANSWKFQELRGVIGNDTLYYLRGGSNNSQSFDNEYITFNANNTGNYVDNSGGQTSLTWNFTDATNKKIVWVWNLPTPVTITWENIYYKNGAIHYTEHYTQNGENEVASGIRIPK